jgi:hypothetical protein
MDGWEIFGIIALVLLGLGAGMSTLSYIRGQDIGVSGGIPTLGTLIFSISNFIPFGMVLFGFIADLIGQEFRYSISSIVGILTMIVNKLVSYVMFDRKVQTPMAGGGVAQGWCAIPGFELLEARSLPMSTAVTSAIAVYYIVSGFMKRPAGQNISISAGLGVFLVANVITMGASGCSEYYYPIGGSFVFNLLLATLLGAACGAIASTVVNESFPDKSPFANVKNLPVGPSATGLQSSGAVGAPATGGSCKPAEGAEEDAMVCEAYRNGQLVTDSLA